jgi:hypothetical protein
MKMFKTPVLLAGLWGMFILKASDFFFVDETKIDMGENNGNGSGNAAITIVKKWDMPKDLAKYQGSHISMGSGLPVSRMNWEKYLSIMPQHHQLKRKFHLALQEITRSWQLLVKPFGFYGPMENYLK